VKSTRINVKNRKSLEEEREGHEYFKEMWKKDERKEEDDESVKGMTDRKETHKEWLYERNYSPWNFNGFFEQQLRFRQN
jgi:hypothetical protein